MLKKKTSKKSITIDKNSTYLAKDNFWTKDFFTTASSNFLTNFQPAEDAAVIKLLTQAGFTCLGKTDLDELACGGSGLLAKNGILANPHDSQRITGGSSSGSTVAVVKGLVSFALASDTGGSIRCPAAYCGAVGFKPSYGLISRYGLIPLSSTLDTVGILAAKVATVKKIFPLIAQKDPHDLLTITKREKKNKTSPPNLVKKIAIIKDLEKHLAKGLQEIYLNTLNTLKKLGYFLEKVELPPELRNNLQFTYLIISCSELLSHLNSLQGVTFGIKENITMTEKRSKYLGTEIKKRLLMGVYFLENSEYLEQARKLRSWVNHWMEKTLNNHNFLIFPSLNSPAPKIKEVSSDFAGSQLVHWSDNLLLLANFAGTPSLSLPIGFVNHLPVSININSYYGKDQEVLRLADQLEKRIILVKK